MELPVFARELPKRERAFGELAVGTLVAVYSESGVPDDPEFFPVACGRVVRLPQQGDDLSSVCRYVSIAPLGDDGKPAPHNFSENVEVTKVFFPPSVHFPFRFFELEEPVPEE